jgi:hypothetical protein
MHIPERFGLFTIIVLGEALLAVVNGIADTHWHLASSFVAACCFGISASFWWIYFDFVETRPIRRWGAGSQFYIYIHLLLVIAIAMVGVGTRRAIVESGGGALSDQARWVLCGGVALYLLAIVLIRIIARSGELIWMRLFSAAVAMTLAALGTGASPLFVAAILVATMVIDIRVEMLYTATLEDAPTAHPDPEGAPPSATPRANLSGTPFCTHLDRIRDVEPKSNVCEECRRLGDDWVQLRLCLTCGYVGCCETSKNKHALAHFHATGHPIIQTIEPGQHWRWCYIDEMYM